MYIKHHFINRNNYEGKIRSGYRVGGAEKRTQDKIAHYQLLKYPPIKTPCKLKYIWHIKGTKGQDADGICHAKKFINDALQTAGIIPNDNLNHLIGFTDEFVWSNEWGVEIIPYY